MWNLGVPAWQIVIRAAVIYGFVLIGLRLAGKREVGELTVTDLIVLLLLANAVQNAMVGPDTSVTGGVVAASVLLGLDILLSRLRLRSPRLRQILEGTPTLLVYQGKILHQNLRRERLDEEDLAAILREHGQVSLEEIDMVVLETNGAISIVPAGGGMKRSSAVGA